MNNSTFPIYVVDDEISILESTTFMLEGYGFKVEAFQSGKQFLAEVDLNQVGCVLLDSRMPEMRGQEVHEQLVKNQSPLSVIFLTGHGDVPMAVEALKQGAVDFFQKPVDVEPLVASINKGLDYSQQQYQKTQQTAKLESLTSREKEVLELLIKGLKNQQMADTLCVSLRTIEVHRSKVMKKLDTANVTVLLRLYGQHFS